MKFHCPYCLRNRFQMVPGKTDEAMCKWCGQVSGRGASGAVRPSWPAVRSADTMLEASARAYQLLDEGSA